MADVAKSLGRPPSYIAKFLGYELGTQVKMDDRCIVPGARTTDWLASLLDLFITKFVICTGCNFPETDLIVAGCDVVKDCRACGVRSPAGPHKLCGYISRHPLDSSWSTRFHRDGLGGEDEDATMHNGIDGFGKTPNSLDEFAAIVVSRPDDAEIIAKAAELQLRDYKVCVVLAQVLFDSQIIDEDQVEGRAGLIRRFITSEKCQRGLLGGIERLLSMQHRAALMRKTPIVLKLFYDAHLIEAKVFLAWGGKESRKYVDRKINREIREKAAPFLTTLRETGEDEITLV
ncbi:hypothetical protein HK101_007950 [Irineochytrium annulatum]|nr:hypothetical protein HK101_007950 [Irineochytrium annulatum]